MKYISIIIFMICVLNVNAQKFKKISLEKADTSTIDIQKPEFNYLNGKVKESGAFRHMKLSYGKITEDYIPIGRHAAYYENGKIKNVQNYTSDGFIINDTSYRENGVTRYYKIYKPEFSFVASNGRRLNFVDRFSNVTFFYKNGNMECEGLAEQKGTVFLSRRDTWNVYHKNGTFKHQLKYKASGIEKIIIPKTKKGK